MDRILNAQPATLQADYGEGSTPGSVSVTITRLDGTVLVSEAAATVVGSTASYALSAVQTGTLDTLTAVWTSDTLGIITTRVEIVGDRLFTIAEARAFDQVKLSSEAEYPDEAIEEALDRIEDDFQRICGVSFIPRYTFETVDGKGFDTLFLPAKRSLRLYAVRSIETRSGTTWTAYTQDELDGVQVDGGGLLVLESGTWPSGRRNVRVGYEHGWDMPPEPIRRAALKVLVHQLVPTNINDRATSVSGENVSYAYATAGRVSNNLSAYPWFGLPEVDTILHRYSEKVPVVG